MRGENQLETVLIAMPAFLFAPRLDPAEEQLGELLHLVRREEGGDLPSCR